MPFATPLSHRTLIRISGSDRHAFLQGLVSNDVTKVSATNAVYAALLTPQGKFLHDLFVIEHEDSFWIDCEKERVSDLLRRLTAYKLRSKVMIEDLDSAWNGWALWDGEYHSLLCFKDPRLPELGRRIFIPKDSVPESVEIVDFALYDKHRLKLGVADASRDMEIEKSTLVEGNFDFLNGVDWKKGCYVGQELTARMHYRGLAKKRLFPVQIDGTAPPHGSSLVFAGNEAGEMRSSCGKYGLALLKIEAAQQAIDQDQPITHGETRLSPAIPLWMKIDAPLATR